MAEVAQLCEAVFMLRLAEGGRVDADFVLTLRTPAGPERWDFGWNLQDVRLGAACGRSARELFDPFMRSLFDDHMSDLAERGLTPDRSYDDLPVRLEVPDAVLQRL